MQVVNRSGVKQLLYIMGQNNSQVIDAKTSLIQHWMPLDKELNVLVNKITHQQVQRHLIKILAKDLPREISHFASRLSNHQPHICRLLHFHPSVPDSRSLQEEKQLRQMHLYTDRMLPLKDWRKEKLVLALQGLVKLVSVHGPIKITENMICEDECGEVKVWMSENPANNHPDSKYMSEGYTVADLIAVLTIKNKQEAIKLSGCHTLRDVLEKMSHSLRQNSAFNTFTHKISQGNEVIQKKYDFKEKPLGMVPYRNVFGEGQDNQNSKAITLTPTKYKGNQLQPNPFRKTEDEKPTSNISQYKDYTAFYQLRTAKKEEKIMENTFTSKKVVNQTSLEYKKCPRESEGTKKQQIKGNKLEINRMNSKGSEFPHNYLHPFEHKSPLGMHRFETSQKVGSPNSFQTKYPSQTTFKATSRQNTQQTSNFATQPASETSKGTALFSKNPPAVLPQSKRGEGITIINNNVSNFFNNIVHNHVLTMQKKGSQQCNIRKEEEEVVKSSNMHSSQKDASKNTVQANLLQKTKEKQGYVPVFIQQKKKIQQFNQEGNSFNHKHQGDKATLLTRQDTVESNLITSGHSRNENPSNFFDTRHDKKREHSFLHFSPKNLERKSEKCNVFNNYHLDFSPSRFGSAINSFYPKTPPPNINVLGPQPFAPFLGKPSLNSFSSNRHSQFVQPLRTKTTQFYRKGLQMKDEIVHNKSFTLQDAEKQKQLLPPHKFLQPTFLKTIEQLTEPKHFLEPTKKSQVKSEVTPEQKTNLKKLLRQEFTSLLGGDSPEHQPKEEQSKKQETKSEGDSTVVDLIDTKKEGEVKQKIIKKQIAFAELKKQALKVLIDQ